MKIPTEEEINAAITSIFAVPEDFDEQVKHAALHTVGKWDGYNVESIQSFKRRKGELGPVWRDIISSLAQL